MNNEYELVVIHVDDLGRDHVIETGLRVLVDDENHRVALPFKDGMTAEEVSRIICGLLTREMS